MIRLDTHVVLGFRAASLCPAEIDALRTDPAWVISPMVLWEIDLLNRKGRITRSVHDDDLRDFLGEVGLVAPDLATWRALSRLDFRSDPADELIAARSIAHNIPLLTRDARIRASNVVPLAL